MHNFTRWTRAAYKVPVTFSADVSSLWRTVGYLDKQTINAKGKDIRFSWKGSWYAGASVQVVVGNGILRNRHTFISNSGQVSQEKKTSDEISLKEWFSHKLKCAPPQAIQNVDEFVSSSNLEKFSIPLLALASFFWIMELNFSQKKIFESKSLNGGFVSHKHADFVFSRCYLMDWVVWIIVMLLSAVWTLMLTAPIHFRGSFGEQVM